MNASFSMNAGVGPDGDAGLRRVVDFFESIAPEDVDRLGQIYSADAYFKDPFNELRGVAGIARIFAHMFVQVEAPRFIVHSAIRGGDEAFLVWDFRFRMKRFSGAEQCIHGSTHIRFDADGLVCFHRDYWDAAEELYEKIPLLGGLMRLLKRQAAK
jgi:ketosteroid isomerase-like protein